MLHDLSTNVALGFSMAFSVDNLLYCLGGVMLGMVVGVIPGIGAITAISLLLPITFYLDPLTSLVLLAGIFYGATYGGSVSAILLGLPGTPASIVTCLDGAPLAQKGRAGLALFMTTVASFSGASIGIVIMMVSSPLIAEFALELGAPEYFSLIVMGLIAGSVISTGSAVKGIAVVILGVWLGLIGIDIYTGIPRFNFGILELSDGVSLVALAMGLFGVADVIGNIRNGGVDTAPASAFRFRAMFPSWGEVRRSCLPMLRGAGIGSFFGALPGTGGTISAFMAYAVEKKVSKTPERFGTGAIEGVVAPESANNASDQTAFIPTMTLGIPGSPTMALMLGALMIQGISPGPLLISEKPDLFWGLVMSFWIGNLLLLICNMPLIPLWIRILKIPYQYLYPAILMFVCIGVFSVNNSSFDVISVMIFAALGYFLKVLDFPVAPLLLGFVLGPLLEENFRRSMILSQGSFDIFVSQPLSLLFIVGALALLCWGLYGAFRTNLRARRA